VRILVVQNDIPQFGAEQVADANGSPSNAQTQESSDDKYDDDDTDDVENIHCGLRFRACATST
jgi:hypothetical protein